MSCVHRRCSTFLRHPLFWALLVSLLLHGWLIGGFRFHLPHAARQTSYPTLQIRLAPESPIKTTQPARPLPSSRRMIAETRTRTPMVHSPPPVQPVTPTPTPTPDNPASSLPGQQAVTPSGTGQTASAPQARTGLSTTSTPPGLTLLPAYFELHYRVNAGPGGLIHGRSSFVWLCRGNQYVLASSIEARGLASLLEKGQLLQISSGHITSAGLQPERYEIRRGDNAPENRTIIRMDHNAGIAHVTRHQTNSDEPLPDQAQDLLSVVFDLASLSPLTKPVDLAVSSGKAFKPYHFRMAGEETLDTSLGKLRTIHLQRPPDHDGDSMDIWLAEDLHHIPVRVLIHHSTWGVIDQTLTDVVDHDPDQAPQPQH